MSMAASPLLSELATVFTARAALSVPVSCNGPTVKCFPVGTAVPTPTRPVLLSTKKVETPTFK